MAEIYQDIIESYVMKLAERGLVVGDSGPSLQVSPCVISAPPNARHMGASEATGHFCPSAGTGAASVHAAALVAAPYGHDPQVMLDLHVSFAK
jgi:hypothetical protein